ncbi:hypothetical protein [Deinococcus aluminii]|uniref:Uncharacterized protein n=1 Tax=Deinococcus aluminii TaxID=1656885 RepID=A0ABP9XFD1_9DEIO
MIIALRAATNGYTCWHGPEHGPLDMDERYLLGYLDCLREQEDTPFPIDWVGNWLCYPNSQLANQLDEDLTWITRASQTRLIDDEHCLLIVGGAERGLAAHAYTERAADGSVVILFHNLAGTQPPVADP